MIEKQRSWAVGAGSDPEWLVSQPSTYAAAGVDREAGSEAVRRIGRLARETFGRSVLSHSGGFGGLFALGDQFDNDTVLVASTDGIGTKSLVASATGRYDTIGRDLVAMNVDDIVVLGATPLFLLDFLVVDSVIPSQVEEIVSGVVAGCLEVGCTLLGGELAEHPGTRAAGEFDLVGFVVGAVKREAILTGDRITPGDVVIGLAADGLRSDGYSFVRKVFADRQLDGPAYPGAVHSLGEELLRPSKIYTPTVLRLIDRVDVHGLAHVTGGGIATNVERVTPPACDVLLTRGRWPVPSIFDEMRRWGGVSLGALEAALPIGIGMVAIVAHECASTTIELLEELGQAAFAIGVVVDGTGRAQFVDDSNK